MDKQYYVYIMTNNHNTVLYTGVTSDLKRRVYEHKHKMSKGFTKKYNVVKLVYYEVFQEPHHAVAREKLNSIGISQYRCIGSRYISEIGIYTR